MTSDLLTLRAPSGRDVNEFLYICNYHHECLVNAAELSQSLLE